MLELAGTVVCDISVIHTGTESKKKLTTTSFTLLVEKAVYGGDDITSDPQYDVLVSLLEAAPTAQMALDLSNQAMGIASEANSKYDACVEATENANNVRAEIVAGGYIESLRELNKGDKFSFWAGTQEEYDALPEVREGCLYIIVDDTTLSTVLENANEVDKIAREANTNATDAYNLAQNKNILTFDKLSSPQLNLNDDDMGTSADDLTDNIVKICEAAGDKTASNSRVFMLRCYLSDSIFPNLRTSILNKINNDAKKGYSGNQLQIEIKGVKQDLGTKDIVVVIDLGETTARYECFLNKETGNNKKHKLSTFVDTTPRFDQCLASGLEAKAFDSISDMSELENYSLIAFRVKIDTGTEWGTVIAYNPKSRLGTEDFYNAGDGVWRVTAQYDKSEKKLTIYSVSKDGNSGTAFVSDIFGVM
jgi:hypothetical protein